MLINLSTIDFSGVSSGSSANLQDIKSQTITENGTYRITPDEGYDAMISTKVYVNLNLGTTNFTVGKNGQFTFYAEDKGLDGMTSVDIYVTVPQENKSFRIPNQWNGSVDSVGLKALNWTDDQIAKYQSLCTWMDYENSEHLVPDYDKTLQDQDTYENDTTLQYARNIDLTNKTSVARMYRNCSNLKAYPYFELNENITTSDAMFQGCTNLTVAQPIDFTKLTKPNVNNFFAECSSLTIAPEINFTTVNTANNFFRNCSSLKYIPDYKFNEAYSLIGFYEGTAVETINEVYAPVCKYAQYLFSNCHELKKIGRIQFDGYGNLNKMLQDVPNLQYIGGFSYSGTYKNSTVCTEELPNLTHFIFEGALNCTWNTGLFNFLPNLDYESIKSILTACSNTELPDTGKSITFANITMQDQNGELQALVDDCVNNKGWTFAGLTITQ